MPSNVLAFPDRGGAGWRCASTARWCDFDQSNLRFAAAAFWKRHGAGGYAVLGIAASDRDKAAAGTLQSIMRP